MTDAARDPDRVSFTAALRITPRTIAHAGDFPPDQAEHDDHGWPVFRYRATRDLGAGEMGTHRGTR